MTKHRFTMDFEKAMTAKSCRIVRQFEYFAKNITIG
jgi:hypothetical protein